MANYTTSADLIIDILNRNDELTDGSSDYQAEALLYLNRAWLALQTGGGEILPGIDETWWWQQKEKSGVLTLQPIQNIGTISVTNNSINITFSSAPTPSLVDYYFKVDDHADVFRIATHTAATTGATLDSVYTGPTNTAASFKAFLTRYDLASDVLYVSKELRAYQSGRNFIPLMDINTMRDRWPLNQIGPGVPLAGAMIDLDTVEFSHFGGQEATELIRVEYDYLAALSDLANDTAEPAIPRVHRKILSDYGTFLLMVDREDNRAEAALGMARAGIENMFKEHRNKQQRQNTNFMSILPRLTDRSRFLRGPLRTESGLIIG